MTVGAQAPPMQAFIAAPGNLLAGSFFYSKSGAKSKLFFFFFKKHLYFSSFLPYNKDKSL